MCPHLVLGTGIYKVYKFEEWGQQDSPDPTQVFTTLAVTYQPWKTMVVVEIRHWLAYHAASV